MTKQARSKHPSRLQRIILEILVPCAMALSAMAFSAGLYVQGGFGMVPSLVAGVTLFLVMLCAQSAYVGSQRAAHVMERLDDLEMAVQGNGDGDQNLDLLSEKVGQIDGLAERLQQIDVLAEKVESLTKEVTKFRPERTDIDPARVQRLAAEVDRIDARQKALRSQLQIEANERFDHLSAELQMLETLVKQMAENMTGAQRAAIERAPMQELPAPDGEDEGEYEASPGEEPGDEAAGSDDGDASRAAADSGAATDREDEPATLEPPIDELPLIDDVRESIESNRIELHLQPIMTLPQRRVRYYEALTRLRSESGDLLMPKDYIDLAETEGIMPVIDNVMLYRSVQVLRRLEKRSSARGVFCNISVHSLLDPEFFPEFITFMEQNQNLSESMYFEFSQSMIDHAGPVEQESLTALAALGFRFSLDHVKNLDIDFQSLQERGFRFIKLDAETLLHGMDDAHAQIHAADMRAYLERFGIQLIVSKIETEQDLSSVLDYNARLGQGFLFSEPRPVRPEVFGAVKESEAAA